MPIARADLVQAFRDVNGRDPSADELARLEAAVPTTVALSGGPAASPDPADGLARVYRDARVAGLGEEGARVAVAIARTEGGLGGAQGDVAAGGSRGAFQLFFGGGQGNNFARAMGLSDADADALLARDPHAANHWALTGYLGDAIRRGMAQGLSGADLATYAQRTGQVSVSPERAGANYLALFGAPAPVPRARQQFLEANTPATSEQLHDTTPPAHPAARGGPPGGGTPDSTASPREPASGANLAPLTTPGLRSNEDALRAAFTRRLLAQLEGAVGTPAPSVYRLPGAQLPGFRRTLASPGQSFALPMGVG